MELIVPDADLKAAVKDAQKQTYAHLAESVLSPGVINRVAKAALLHTGSG